MHIVTSLDIENYKQNSSARQLRTLNSCSRFMTRSVESPKMRQVAHRGASRARLPVNSSFSTARKGFEVEDLFVQYCCHICQ
jgi:hypothetical protein